MKRLKPNHSKKKLIKNGRVERANRLEKQKQGLELEREKNEKAP